MLLLIACTNIAALLLSRAARRQHEISVRFSLGASRASIAAQLLTEVFVLALAGAALGLFLAGGASSVFRGLAKDLPRIEEIGLDWRIALYSLACALVATLLCGLFPAIRGARRDLGSSLARAGRQPSVGSQPCASCTCRRASRAGCHRWPAPVFCCAAFGSSAALLLALIQVMS